MEFSPPTAFNLHILYLDESGTTSEASCFVLAGLAVFEQDIYFYSQEMDILQNQYFPEVTEPILFHATKLRVPDNTKLEEPLCRIKRDKRIELKDKIFNIISTKHGVLFGCVIDKRFTIARGEDCKC